MSDLYCYKHYLGDKIVLIPVPPLTEAQQDQNRATFGRPWGISKLPIITAGGLTIDITDEIMLVSKESMDQAAIGHRELGQ